MKVAMKFFGLLFVFALLLLPLQTALAAPSGALANPFDEFVFGGNYVLTENDTLNGNLWVFGGNADIRNNARVNGNIFLAGGNLTVYGIVEGNIQATGGNVDLRSTAVINGDVNLVGANISQALGAQVQGSIQDNQARPFHFTAPSGAPVPQFSWWYTAMLNFLGFVFSAVVISGLAILVAMFAPRHTNQVAQTTIRQPLISGGLGCLTLIVAPVVLFVLSLTIILIPVSLLLGVALGLLLLFGWIAVGMEVGKRLTEMLKVDWPLPIATGVGTLLLTVIIGGLAELSPDFIGWVFPTLILIVGLGAALLTRLGTQSYPAYMTSRPVGIEPARPVSTDPNWPVYTPLQESSAGVYPVDEDVAPPTNPYDPIIPPAPDEDDREIS